jgi:Undecaprenyl-phosphate glucose phosphotransferase
MTSIGAATTPSASFEMPRSRSEKSSARTLTPVWQSVDRAAEWRHRRPIRFQNFAVNELAWGLPVMTYSNARERDAVARSHYRDRSYRLFTPTVVSGLNKVMDFCIVVAAAQGAYILYPLMTKSSLAGGPERYALPSLLAATVLVAGIERLSGYSLKRLTSLRWQVLHITEIWIIVVLSLLIFAFFCKVSQLYSRIWLFNWIMVTLGLLVGERIALFLLIARSAQQGYFVRRVVIVGGGDLGERVIRRLQRSLEHTVVISGVFDDRQSRTPSSVAGIEVLGSTDDLLRFARQVPIDEIILALPLDAEQRIKMLLEKLRQLPVDLRLSAESIAQAFPIRGFSYVGDVPVLEIVDRPIKHWDAVAKWVEDRVLAALMLALLAPGMMIIALLIKWDSHGPVFFVQERLGFNNKVIRVLKFRTMYVDCEDRSGAMRTVRKDPRVTRIGRVLRALSLDELPQLINVLRGDMSVVGPRRHATGMKAGDRPYPDAITQYLDRHRVRPGITGWAQVHGLRGEIDTLEKARARVEHDLYYIERWSLWLDLKTLALTVPAVISGRNAY